MIKKILLAAICWVAWVGAYAMTPPSTSEPVPVDIGFHINDITNIDEREQNLTVEGTLFLGWTDRRVPEKLKLTETQYFQDDAAKDVLKTIWWPYVKIIHLKGTRRIGSLLLEVRPDGRIEYFETTQITAETTIDMRRFPFDTQVLDIRFEPFYDHYPDIKFKQAVHEEGVAPDAHSAEWAFHGFKSRAHSPAIEKGRSGDHYIIEATYKRKSSFYVLNIFGPLVLIVMVGWSVFWLWRQRTINRIALLKTAILAILVFQWVIYKEEPRVSYYTFFDSFIAWSFFVLGLSAIVLVISYNVVRPVSKRLEWHCRWAAPLLYCLGVCGLVLIFFT